jgi:hypothetical protein
MTCQDTPAMQDMQSRLPILTAAQGEPFTEAAEDGFALGGFT